MQNDNRNTLIFVVCAGVLLVLYQVFVLQPAARQREQAAKAAAVAQASAPAGALANPSAVVTVPRAQALAASPQRIRIDSPGLTGSIAVTGARIDDLYLKGYRQTVAKNSPPVEMFRPAGAVHTVSGPGRPCRLAPVQPKSAK